MTGSIKFDQQTADRRDANPEFSAILEKLKRGKPVVLAASTHDGEEVLIAEAARKAGGFPLIVPRHAERRHAVVKDLSARSWQCILRTEGEIPETLKENVCYVVDTTGELRDWTALADVAVIGKSFLADGGQNPAEAVACGVPVLTGPHMENFDAPWSSFWKGWMASPDAEKNSCRTSSRKCWTTPCWRMRRLRAPRWR